MHVLGINAYHGDAAAALIKDDRIIAAVEEERFNRIKHCAGFPTETAVSSSIPEDADRMPALPAAERIFGAAAHSDWGSV